MQRKENEKKETENPLIFFYRVCSRRIIRNYHRLNYFKCVEILKNLEVLKEYLSFSAGLGGSPLQDV